jgi:hypothetical protein
MRASRVDEGGNLPPGAWNASFDALVGRHPRRALLLAALVLGAFSATWFLLQSPDFYSGYDFVRMHAFYKEYFRDSLLSGRAPLWDPYVGLGRPFLADIETQTLYPPNLLVLPFGVRGGVALSIWLHQALAIYGGFRLGRVQGGTNAPALLLGLGLALASPFAARLATGMVPVYCSLCWWPVLLWLAACLQDRWDRRTAAGFAVAVAMAVLAGNPPILFVELFGVLVFLLGRLGRPRGAAARRAAFRRYFGLLLAALLGFGLAAVQLLPFAGLVSEGNRPLRATGFALANGMPPASWLSLLVPASAAFAPNWEYDLYCGLLPLLAAAGGLLLWRDRNARALLALGLLGALLAAGSRTPVLGWVVALVPGASALRIPPRYGIWLATAVLGLAALALSRRPRHLLVASGAFLAAAITWIVWLRPYVAHDRPAAARYYALHLVPLGLAALLLAAWQKQGRKARWAGAGAILVLFCLADWLAAIRLQAPVYSLYGFHTEERAVEAGLAARGLLVPDRPPPRIAFNPVELAENAGMSLGFSTYNSYVNPALSRVWGYLHSASGLQESGADFIRLPQAVDHDPGRLDGLDLVAELGHPGRSLEIHPAADPRAYVVFEGEAVPDWRRAESLMASGHPFHRRALLEPGSPPFAAVGGEHTGWAEIRHFRAERVVVQTRADVAGVLILAEAWYPGWQATIGGRPLAVFPVNGWMRGVVIPAGGHEVVFSYRERLLGPGLALSLLSAAAVAALLLSGRRRDAQTDSRIL